MQPTSQTDTALPSVPDVPPAIASALGRIPSGLFVISWREEASDRTMLASWVMQAGFAPPLVSIAVAASRDLLAALERGTPFAASILGESQRSLLSRFGKPSADAFDGLAVHRTPSGSAALADAAAWLECRRVAAASHGDHVVVLAEVTSAGGGEREPLVHVRRNGLRY
jgi:flavin reductase (DIM6/NTAB) family NADH-FMN oxidoreductase RutF